MWKIVSLAKIAEMGNDMQTMDGRVVRRTCAADIPALMDVFGQAKAIMRSDGNFHQWAGPYPSVEKIREDISRKVSHVICDGGRIVGTFAFIPGIEPTYKRIYSGRWLDPAAPYATIHRIASTIDSTGVFDTLHGWCAERMPSIRIDTHRDNHIMQHLIEKYGFTYCGIIYLADGSERLAFQKTADVERLRSDAKLILPARAGALAERYGFEFNRVFIKHNKSNWGSCSTKGNINLNLNLVRLPSDLRDYVILHELCHLRQMNHGAAFHDLLESLCLEHFGGTKNDSLPLHLSLRARLREYWLV